MIDYDEWLMSGYDPYDDEDEYEDEDGYSVGELLSELFREGMKSGSINAKAVTRFIEREE